MIRRGARPGVARPQHTSERFTGGIEVGEQRVEPEPTLVRRRRLLLLRMGSHECGVDIDHIEPRIRTRCPRVRSGLGACGLDPFKRVVVDGFEGAPHRGVRCHLTEQGGLIAQHRDIRDRFAAIGEHHRDIDEHLTAVMATATLLRWCHRHRQRRGQPDLVSEIGEHSGARMVHDAGPVTG
jgi:hypothetical protein